MYNVTIKATNIAGINHQGNKQAAMKIISRQIIIIAIVNITLPSPVLLMAQTIYPESCKATFDLFFTYLAISGNSSKVILYSYNISIAQQLCTIFYKLSFVYIAHNKRCKENRTSKSR